MTLRKIAHRWNSQKGFTLVELLMAMLIFSLVMSGVFTVYRTQQRSQTAQEAVADLQQNIRSAMLMMTRDIREAGCDPTGKSGAGIVVATPGVFRFTRDIAGDAFHANDADGNVFGPEEDVTFGFSAANDADRNGVADTGNAALGRDTGGGFQPIAENIAAIQFNYLLTDGTSTLAPTGVQIPLIAGVQISLLARANRTDPDYTDTKIYTTAAGTPWGPFGDTFRRKLDIVTVQIRNKF